MSKAQSERNLSIYADHKSGLTNRTIASHYQLTEQRVSQIICSFNRMAEPGRLGLTPDEAALHGQLESLNRKEALLLRDLMALNKERTKLRTRLNAFILARIGQPVPKEMLGLDTPDLN